MNKQPAAGTSSAPRRPLSPAPSFAPPTAPSSGNRCDGGAGAGMAARNLNISFECRGGVHIVDRDGKGTTVLPGALIYFVNWLDFGVVQYYPNNGNSSVRLQFHSSRVLTPKSRELPRGPSYSIHLKAETSESESEIILLEMEDAKRRELHELLLQLGREEHAKRVEKDLEDELEWTQSEKATAKCPHGDWFLNLDRLYGDIESTDCSIKVGKESVKAHKLVLMAQSPVLRSCFGNPFTNEAKSGVIEFTDLEDSSGGGNGGVGVQLVRAFTYYCYHGHLSEEFMASDRRGELAEQLFQLADKYFVEGLRELAEERLVETTRLGNLLHRAVFADANSAQELKEKCAQVLSTESRAIFASVEWKELKQRNSELTSWLAEQATIALSTKLSQQRKKEADEIAQRQTQNEYRPRSQTLAVKFHYPYSESSDED